MAAASSSSFLLPLLLFLISPSPSSSARLPRSSNPLCIKAPFPLLCAQLPPSHSSRQLAEHAARAASSKISAAIPAINKIRSGFANNKRMTSTLDVCAEVYADAADALNSAADALRGGGKIFDIMTGLSASLTDICTCDDAFDEDPSLINPLARISKNLNRLVTNSLTLASSAKRSL